MRLIQNTSGLPEGHSFPHLRLVVISFLETIDPNSAIIFTYLLHQPVLCCTTMFCCFLRWVCLPDFGSISLSFPLPLFPWDVIMGQDAGHALIDLELCPC